jgi:uncharacterized protein YggU (UPF0235/DUF167 family)
LAQNPSPLTPFPGGVRVSVRLTPRASSDRLGGVVTGADGRKALQAWVSAPPEDGKANAALLKLLAKSCRMPASSFAVARGQAQRLKLVEVAGDAAELMQRLETLVGENG